MEFTDAKRPPDSVCNVCGTPTSSICSQCHAVYYCSKQCQQSEHEDHAEYCKSIGAADKHMWGISEIYKVSQNMTFELTMHRKLLQLAHVDKFRELGLWKEDEWIRDFFRDNRGKNALYVACMMYDIYSSYIFPSNIIIEDMTLKRESDEGDIEALAASLERGKNEKMNGNAYFIGLSSGCCDYYACLVRCPAKGGSVQNYHIFQSHGPEYGLREWMDKHRSLETVLVETNVSQYIAQIRKILKDGGCTDQLSGCKSSSMLKHGHSFYFRSTSFRISDVYRNLF